MFKDHMSGMSSAASDLESWRRQRQHPSRQPWLSTREAARALGLSDRAVRRAIARGDLVAVKEGASYRIARHELARFAEDLERAGSPRPLAHVVALPSITEAIAPLPAPLSSFIGREEDTARVAALLGDPAVRLVTLTGPGGIGKTRLAIAVASAMPARFPDGVAFVELEAVRRAEHVVPAIARALGLREPVNLPQRARSLSLGLREPAGESQRERLRAYLRSRRLLLVLDNFEQVLDAAPEIVALLTAAPRVTALVTSRAPLQVDGEREVPIAPLPLAPARAGVAELLASDAGRLFIERAQAHAPGLIVDDAAAAHIAAICERLDGLPLAIELAAARVKALPPRDLLARLENRLSLLTRGSRAASPRHAAMRNTIAWSYELLAPEAQALFRRLAVFTGGFTLAAAEWVMGESRSRGVEKSSRVPRARSQKPITHHPSPITLDILSNLVDQSLLIGEAGPDGASRFRMLETIREFGLEQLSAAGEEDEARASHARYFLAEARGLRPLASNRARHAPFHQQAMEQANLHGALSWLDERGADADFVALAADLGLSWYAYGLYREGERLLERALARIDRAPPADQARLLIGYAGVLFGRGEFARMEPFLERGLELTERAGDPLDKAVALTLRGAAWNSAGQYGPAEAPLQEALAMAEQLADPLLRAAVAGRALGNLSVSARGQGDYARATAYSKEALRLYAGHGLELAEAVALMNLGSTARDAGDHALALTRLCEGLVLMGERGDMRLVADALSGIACVATAWGDDRSALLLFGAADVVRERVGAAILWPSDIAAFERGLATLQARLGEREFAAVLDEGRALSLAGAIAVASRLTPPAAAGETAGESAAAGATLTRREIEVLRLLHQQMTDREIAAALFLSRRTVNWHVRSIMTKLGASSRAEAVTRAHESGLLGDG